MDFIWNRITDWLKEILVGGIMGNLQGLFDQVNTQVAGIAGQVGTTPQVWNGGVYSLSLIHISHRRHNRWPPIQTS